MADGEERSPEQPVDHQSSIWNEIFSNRQTKLVGFWLAVFMALVAAMAWNTFIDDSFLSDPASKLNFGAVAFLFLFPAVIWFRDNPDNYGRGPSIVLPLLSLVILISVTFVVVADKALQFNHLSAGPNHSELQRYIWIGLVLVFLPLVWNARNFHRYRNELRERRLAEFAGLTGVEGSDSEALNAMISTVSFLCILGLAYLAGEAGPDFRFQSAFGVFLFVLVIFVFAVVVFIESLVQLPPIRWMGNALKEIARYFRWLAQIYKSIDTLLVNLGAFALGMWHRRASTRYFLLSCTLICLAIQAWFLPPPLGFIPALIGLVLAFSVSRLWAWVEDDRALSVLTNFKSSTPYRTEMHEDYRDETLLGFIFVFALMPIMMAQLQFGRVFGEEIFRVPDESDKAFLSWVAFFGIELAKAVPIVDWSEIYQVGSESTSTIQMNKKFSRHAVFLARATVDFALIASLLQAISIYNRSRQQKQLFRARTEPASLFQPGLIDRLDVFVERTEIKRAINASKRVGVREIPPEVSPRVAHETYFDLSVLNREDLINFRRYNGDRLFELYAHSKDASERAFIAAIAHERPDFSLKTRFQLLQELSENNSNESELYAVLAGFESELKSGRAGSVSVAEVRSVLFNLRNRSGLKDLKSKLISILEELEPKIEVIEALADVAGESNADAFAYARVAAVDSLLIVALTDGSDVRMHQVSAILKRLGSKKDQAKMTQKAISIALGKLKSESAV
ncbi:MAG: hypothetical protein AAGJ29_06160 [Pseudomonadota bacterium]